ncbi:MAG: hypothetical protein M1840_006410 [Geoglossum simile]|nr:MAG: hypothetical protein M1840_006410 [Geoglossum simile]
METEYTTNGGNWAIFSATALSRHGFERCLSIPSLMRDGWAENRLQSLGLWLVHLQSLLLDWINGLNLGQMFEPWYSICVRGFAPLARDISFTAHVSLGSNSGGIEQFKGTLSPEDIKDDPFHDESSTDRSDPFASWSDESGASTGTDTEQPSSENLNNKDYKHSLKVPTKDLLELRAHLVLEPSHREVLEHLTFANLRRRNRFWYTQKHAGKLAAAQTILFPEQSKASITEQDLPSKQLQLPLNEDFRPAAASKAGTLSTITGTAASEGKIESRKLDQMAHHQQAMSRASVSLKESGWRHLPEQRKTFRCPCCYLTLSSPEAERWHWRKHLSADICPYTCLFPDCSMESPLFATRDQWKTHLRLDHQSSDYWECFACTDADNAIVFSTHDEFLAHMKELHKDVVSDVDAPRLLDICVRSDPISVKMYHIGDHMHDFALRSLPWMDTPENTRPKYLTDETVQKIAKWFNEMVPNVESAEEHHPAYPSEETVMRVITFSVGLPELRPCDFGVSGELGSNIDPQPW